jgi:predicted ATPase
LLSLLGDNTALVERADQLIAVTTEQSFPQWRAHGAIYRGWVKVKNGDVAEGISLLSGGSAGSRAAAAVWTPYHLALLAGAYAIAGQIRGALSLVDEALQIVEGTGERLLVAELNRYKGQLLLRQGHSEAPKICIAKRLTSHGCNRPSFGNCAPP